MKERIILSTMLVILLFSACTAPVKEEQATQPINDEPIGSIQQQEEELLYRYVDIYEKYCSGIAFARAEELSQETIRSYLLGSLIEAEQLEQYAVYNGSEIDYYLLPEAEAEAFYADHFGQAAILSAAEQGDLTIDVAAVRSLMTTEIEARVKAYETLDNGNRRVTIQRFVDGGEWLPAVYEFAPAQTLGFAQEKTELSPAFYFVSLENLPQEQPPVQGQMISIGTPQELVALAELVNSGDWQYQNNIYQLTSDLDMSGIEFQPIGGGVVKDPRNPAPIGFNTSFDGKGHTIRNLTVKKEAGAAGLFARLSDNGFVGDLTLENCHISAESNDGFNPSPVGGIAGEMTGGAINRCTVNGTVKGSIAVGGLVGRIGGSASVQDSRVNAVVSGSQAVGGAVGLAEGGKIIQCTAVGKVNAIAQRGKAPRELGGFIGRNAGALIDRGIVSVELESRAAAQVGSFAGYHAGELLGCFYNTDTAGAWEIIGFAETPQDYKAEIIGMTQQQLKEMGAL